MIAGLKLSNTVQGSFKNGLHKGTHVYLKCEEDKPIPQYRNNPLLPKHMPHQQDIPSFPVGIPDAPKPTP